MSTTCNDCGGPVPDGVACGCVAAVDMQHVRMLAELRENAHKGGRRGPRGWLSASPATLVAELHYHAAKLTYAERQYRQGDGDWQKVVEFAADVGNCAFMIADRAGLLVDAAGKPAQFVTYYGAVSVWGPDPQHWPTWVCTACIGQFNSGSALSCGRCNSPRPADAPFTSTNQENSGAA